MAVNPLVVVAIVDAIVDELCGRFGFNEWWDHIEEPIRRELKATLQRRVREVLS